jgi:L-alanine-DL-glutamate epimerase-like enolase superfamily enzyme
VSAGSPLNREVDGAAGRATDVAVERVTLYFLPVAARVPYRFGHETLTTVTCARVRLDVTTASGRRASGWGETPLSVGWMWPSSELTYAQRFESVAALCRRLVVMWSSVQVSGHPLEIGHHVNSLALPREVAALGGGTASIPRLAALVCNSAFDLALHDAYGMANGVPTFDTYTAEYMNTDLSAYLRSAPGAPGDFRGVYPVDFLSLPRADRLTAWHSVGSSDPLHGSELTGAEPRDGYPVLLADWIERDGLTCLKVKLSGEDWHWDLARLRQVGAIGRAGGVSWLCADYNCTAPNVNYVTTMLDRLLTDDPLTYQMLLYVEQPFDVELQRDRLDVSAVAARKPIFLDESAHDWEQVALGLSLGWNGVALKTCKTLTGALLSLCWAKHHGMTVMVQDLTNPRLAQVTHALLAAHAGTVMGLETNAMQIYPAASDLEARVQPGLYRRQAGTIDLTTLSGPGFGYGVERIGRALPEPVAVG